MDDKLTSTPKSNSAQYENEVQQAYKENPN